MNATIASSSSLLRRSDLHPPMAKASLGEVRESDPDRGRRFRVTDVRMVPCDVAPRDAGVVIVAAADVESGSFEAVRVPPARDDERGQAVLPVERDTSRRFTWLLGIVTVISLAGVVYGWLVAR